MIISPSSGICSPDIILASVVFPAPLSPTKATEEFFFIEKLMLSIAFFPLNDSEIFFILMSSICSIFS